MKNISILLVVFFLFVACGGGEKVIMDSGKVYTVKGNNFYSNGNEITDQLSSSEKSAIKITLESRLKAEELAEEKQKQLKEQQREAEKRAKALKEEKERIEKRQKALEDARDDYLKAKKRLNDEEEEFEELKKEGKLSEVQIEEYETEIAKLKVKVKEVKAKLDALERS